VPRPIRTSLLWIDLAPGDYLGVEQRLNYDGEVNGADAAMLIDLLGKRYQGPEDLNDDMVVDLADVLEIALNWGPCR